MAVAEKYKTKNLLAQKEGDSHICIYIKVEFLLRERRIATCVLNQSY
jgi:hypothetical protein